MAASSPSADSDAAITALPEGDYLTTNEGYRIHYWHEGKSSSDAVVFLHGSGPGASGYSNFKGNYPYLLEQGYQVLVLDHIGYGRSDKPRELEYHVDVFVHTALAVLDHLGLDSFVPVGNSLGGAIAIKMALDYPERVRQLILMAPGGLEEKERYFTMPGMQAMGDFFRNAYSTASGVPAVEDLRSVLKNLVHDPVHIDEPLVQERFQVCRQQHPGVMATMKVPNMSDQLSRIHCPVLAFWGAAERFMPVEGAYTLASRCPDCRVIIQSRCGHWYMVEYAEDFNRHCAQFLSSRHP